METKKFSAQQWLDIYEERLQDALLKHGIGKTGSLASSFVKTVILNADAEPAKMQMQFLFYGRFRDMGVGRGQALGFKKEKNIQLYRTQNSFGRKPAKWYSKTTGREIEILAQLLKKHFGIEMIQTIESNLNDLTAPINI